VLPKQRSKTHPGQETVKEYLPGRMKIFTRDEDAEPQLFHFMIGNTKIINSYYRRFKPEMEVYVMDDSVWSGILSLLNTSIALLFTLVAKENVRIFNSSPGADKLHGVGYIEPHRARERSPKWQYWYRSSVLSSYT